MTEQKAKKKEQESCQRKKKWIWFVAIVILVVAICCYFLLKFQSVDEQLAAIEAAHAIPDAENAAIIYNQLMENYDKSAFLYDSLSRQPWLSKDYPEQAEWLKDMQDTISTLLEASKKEKCRFPIITNSQQLSADSYRINAMRKWTRLLIRAINNDIAEGRIDAGIQKCNCLIRMGEHLCQQPVLVNYIVGVASEALALRSMNTLILEDDVSEKHLKIIEAAIPQTKDNWAEVSSKIIEFETLYERKNVSFFKRAGWWLRGLAQDIYDRFHTLYLRQLASRRGSRILIALRRYRNKNGRWPETLEGIKDLVPEEILIDSINGGSFVYKLTEEDFTLYSKGLNNIDEGGKRKQSGADDWPIWPTGN
ncbi:MAG: hypothetical protein ACYSWZ_17420 [Planctomycetota bacterium]|jgi:hypothetical protein